MPADRFICPDGNECDIQECLNGCRIPEAFESERCLSKPTLAAIAQQREWTGIPSTTQLLNGTREVYLRITNNYPIDPQDMIWAIFGTGVHSAIEAHTGDGMAEERIFDEYSSGSFDYFEPDTGFLYDRKTYGSYKTAKTLGIKKVREPVLDDDGTQKKYKNGKLMYLDRWDIGHKSRLDLAMQLNDYRTKLESKGYNVSKLFCEILTRDGGTHIAKSRGVDKNAMLIRVNKISDIWIKRYMAKKAKDLQYALETNTLPRPCSHRETWGGLKCQRFCAVWFLCDKGRIARGTEEENPFAE